MRRHRHVHIKGLFRQHIIHARRCQIARQQDSPPVQLDQEHDAVGVVAADDAFARRVQDLFLSGKRAEAVAAVPDELADEIALLGPPERIRDRLQAWTESPVTTLIVGSQDPRVLRLLAEALL